MDESVERDAVVLGIRKLDATLYERGRWLVGEVRLGQPLGGLVATGGERRDQDEDDRNQPDAHADQPRPRARHSRPRALPDARHGAPRLG